MPVAWLDKLLVHHVWVSDVQYDLAGRRVIAAETGIHLQLVDEMVFVADQSASAGRLDRRAVSRSENHFETLSLLAQQCGSRLDA